MDRKDIQEKMLAVMPLWHLQIEKPFHQMLDDDMSTSMYYSLRGLQWMGGHSTMSDLAEWTRMPKQQATKVVNKLVDEEYVVRLNNPLDRRVIQIELTEKGTQFIDHFLATEAKSFETLLDEMDDATATRFEIGLDALYSVLSNAPGVRMPSGSSLHLAAHAGEDTVYPAIGDKKATRRLNMEKKIIQQPIGVLPTPNLIVSCRRWDGRNNGLAVGFACNASMDPPLVMIGIVPEHYSYELIKKSKEFVINLPGKNMKDTFDYLGSHSGRDGDKFAAANVQWVEGTKVWAPVLTECPMNAECKVTEILEFGGDHSFFVASIEAVHCITDWLRADGTLDYSKVDLL